MMRLVRVLGALALLVGSSACGDDSESESKVEPDAGGATPRDASSGRGGAGAKDAGPPSGASADAGDEIGRDGGAVSAPDAGDGGAGEALPVELPEGSRELDGVLNLVDAELAEELGTFMQRASLATHPVLQRGLLKSTNRFLELYPEEYDFILFLTDGFQQDAFAGRHQTINHRATVGSGKDMELALGDYRSNGRLRAVAGVQYDDNYYGPYGHEIAHYWINGLHHSLGFGESLEGFDGSHWGFTSVGGHLGGFDASSLRCQSPADAALSACAREASGRVRYLASNFSPSAGGGFMFSPFELYLMGFGPITDVPESFIMLERAALVPDSLDQTTRTITVEADGHHSRPFTDIVALHGEVTPLPQAQRELKAAFVLLSAEPVSDARLTDVARMAAVFGGRQDDARLLSWSELALGLSSMDTRLGARRARAEPIPEPAPGSTCNTLQQDCARDELACYGFSVPVCMLAGPRARGESCIRSNDCQAGLDCVGKSQDEAWCQPYCAPDKCPTICQHHLVVDSDGNVVGAICDA